MRLLAALFLGLFAAAAHAEAIGVFTSISGEVQLLRDKSYLAAAPGVDVERDDIIETGKDAAAQLDMEDGSVLRLGPDTRLALADYRLDSNHNVVSATLDVLSGWMRFAVATLKPEGSYRIHTPVLTVGIRGTEGTIQAENEQGGVHLEHGDVEVAPRGGDLKAAPPVRITSGEYIQRARGQALVKHAQPPPEFARRMPPVMRERMVRRAHELRQRGVPPRVIRQMTREDAKRFMERHPHMNEQMRERFRQHSLGAPSPRREPPSRVRQEVQHRREQQQNPPANTHARDGAKKLHRPGERDDNETSNAPAAGVRAPEH